MYVRAKRLQGFCGIGGIRIKPCGLFNTLSTVLQKNHIIITAMAT